MRSKHWNKGATSKYDAQERARRRRKRGREVKTKTTDSATTTIATETIPFSLRMWKWAAKQQSNVYANIRVGDMYFYGLQGIAVDMNQAATHYHRASTFGSAQSMFNLGWHYQYGVGVSDVSVLLSTVVYGCVRCVRCVLPNFGSLLQVPLDYHLSKRYYDRAFETSPRDALYPSKLGLLSLFV